MKNIKTKFLGFIIVSLILVYNSYAQTPWQLQTWTQVYGTVNGENLGEYVNSVPPNTNFPYRAVISSGSSALNKITNAYTLSSPEDTTIKATFRGTNMLIGDLNDDGYVDLVVKTTTRDDTIGQHWDTVFVYWGTQTGIDTLNPLKIPAEAYNLDLIPAAIADLNNDGKQDLILKARGFNIHTGRVYIYLNPVSNSIPNYVLTGDTILSQLGVNVAVCDLNNDSFNDLIIHGQYRLNQPYYNYVNIYYGIGADTVNTTLGQQIRSPEYVVEGLACFDVNGDGIDDLLYPNYLDSLSYGIFVHYGKESLIDSIPNLILQNPGVGDFGRSIINAGDMNGDGYDDIAVTAPHATFTSGFVFIYGGGPEIDKYFDAGKGMSLDSRFGTSIASLGDINGDGLSDIIVGAPQYDFGNKKGYWGVFLGDTNIIVTDVKPEEILNPEGFQLYQNYPNPFNPKTVIGYQLPVTGNAKITVYDILGNEVTVLINQEKSAGNYEIEFDAEKYNLSSGVYFYKLKTEGGEVSRKMIYLK
jgi:hypothetical protein